VIRHNRRSARRLQRRRRHAHFVFDVLSMFDLRRVGRSRFADRRPVAIVALNGGKAWSISPTLANR